MQAQDVADIPPVLQALAKNNQSMCQKELNMKFKSIVRSGTSLSVLVGLLGGATPAFAETEAASGYDASKYQAIVRCVDDFFYEGGYDTGDRNREALMTEVLKLQGQPSFTEDLSDESQAGSLNMPVYMDCISGDLGEQVMGIASEIGIQMPDY